MRFIFINRLFIFNKNVNQFAVLSIADLCWTKMHENKDFSHVWFVTHKSFNEKIF